jgi:hypothetical protein
MIALLALVWCQVLLVNSCDNYYEVTESSARTCYNDLTIGLGVNDRMSIESATCASDSDIQLSWMKSGDVEEMWLYLRCELTNGSTVFIPGPNELTDYHNSGNLQLSYPSLPLNVKHCYIFGCWLYLYVSYCDSGHFIYNHPLTCRSSPMPSPSLSIASSAVFTNSPLPSISFMDDSIISSPLLSAYITESISTTTTISTASDDVTTTSTRKSLQTSTASTTTITTASSTSVSTSLAIPTTSNSPFTDNQLMVILIIGLVIAIATSGLVICAFIFAVLLVIYKRKRRQFTDTKILL